MDIENVNQTLLDETISKFSQEPVNEQGWSNRTLHLLRITLDKCKKRYEKHTEASHKCHKLHRLISIPGIITSGIATSLAFWVVGSPSSATFSVSVTVAILSASSSILKAIETTLRYNEQEYKHKRAVDVYGTLSRRIEINILQPDSDAKIVLNDIKKDYEIAVTHSPYISI